MINFARLSYLNLFYMIKGLFYIFAFYFLGELISKSIGGFIPGSVIGMVLLFLGLYFKLVKADDVKDTATVITKNMAIFFVPTAVGLMAYGDLLAKNFWAIFTGITLSTILTIATVATLQDRFEKQKKTKAKK
jgi:holin-like protein